MSRAPWSLRRTSSGEEQFFALREGVPDGLLRSVLNFIEAELYVEGIFGPEPRHDLHDSFARRHDFYLPEHPEQALNMFENARERFLDIIDFVLGNLEPDSTATQAKLARLESHLIEARSAYTVGIDGDGYWELQDRQPPEVTELIERAASGGDRSAEHLRRAWSKLYRRDPDYNAACLDAVAAVEVAAKPVVSPNNSGTTLGTVLRDLKAKPSKWTTASEADADIDKVIAMLELIWQGHYRHGDAEDPIDVAEPGAAMVVQLAAVLVGWFNAGYVRPT